MPPSALRTSKSADKPNRVVQFSPDTKTTSQQPSTAPVSYNRWIVNAGVIESSFTGQPIKVSAAGPGAAAAAAAPQVVMKRQPPTPTNRATAVPPPMAPTAPVEDEVRKWTEKKKRSRSAPRGSELDELMGSSKAKPKNRFVASVLPASLQERRSSSPPPIRRQSRVELYENDRKKLKEREKRSALVNGVVGISSIAKMINRFSRHGGSTPALNEASGGGGDSPPRRGFMDEEHEREIVEREKRGRMKALLAVNQPRPDIVHPIDFHSGAVEVVPIRPNASGAKSLVQGKRANSYQFGQQQPDLLLPADLPREAATARTHVYEKAKTAGVHKSSPSVFPAKVIAAAAQQAAAAAATVSEPSKPRVDYTDSKDSGHETSSIHTDNSDSGSSNSSGGSPGEGGQHSRTPSGLTDDVPADSHSTVRRLTPAG